MENSYLPSFGSSTQVFPFIEYQRRGSGVEKPSALIVEDDRDIGALFRHVLDLAGYRTEIVLHGQVAVEHLAKSTPDIVLLDLNLPGVSGGEILVRMRSDERLKNVPVVVITAHAHLIETLTVKPQLVLIKPVNIEQMTNLISRICPAEKSMESLPWDVLTGMYNRSFFIARLKYALERTKQLHQNQFAVLYLDLGQSVKVDYLFGGDHNKRVLKDSAALLKTALRPTDTIARLGGDLFAILIEDVNNHETPIQIASRIQTKIRKYLAKLENELQVRANVGIILCGAEYASVDDILHAAERALDLAKSDRKQMLQILRSKSFETVKDMGSMSPIR
jgi:diguanylate cyclase (GGDEF)-like protein